MIWTVRLPFAPRGWTPDKPFFMASFREVSRSANGPAIAPKRIQDELFKQAREASWRYTPFGSSRPRCYVKPHPDRRGEFLETWTWQFWIPPERMNVAMRFYRWVWGKWAR